MTDAEHEYEDRFGFLDNVVESMGMSVRGKEIRAFVKDQIEKAEQRGRKEESERAGDWEQKIKLIEFAAGKKQGLLRGAEIADGIHLGDAVAEALRKEAND